MSIEKSNDLIGNRTRGLPACSIVPQPTMLWVTGLLTQHCHLKGHRFKMGLTDSPTCERCLEKDESATHILRDCEAIAYLRFRHLGHYFMEPGDY
jgi:hypothetical protein